MKKNLIFAALFSMSLVASAQDAWNTLYQATLSQYDSVIESEHSRMSQLNSTLQAIQNMTPAQLDSYSRQLDRLNARLDAQNTTLRLRGESQARSARIKARQEYLRDTGKTFSPNYPDGAPGSWQRTQWNHCKRIYDIYR